MVKNMKKEYDADILKAFSQSYFTGVLVNVREDRYEVLHLASWMRYIPEEGSYTKFLEEILNDSIMQEYLGQLREKLNLSYIKKTLNKEKLTEVDRSYYVDYKVIRGEQRRWKSETCLSIIERYYETKRKRHGISTYIKRSLPAGRTCESGENNIFK